MVTSEAEESRLVSGKRLSEDVRFCDEIAFEAMEEEAADLTSEVLLLMLVLDKPLLLPKAEVLGPTPSYMGGLSVMIDQSIGPRVVNLHGRVTYPAKKVKKRMLISTYMHVF